ncbi:MAG: salicylate hydroxylase [Betaproteobacteria bacterium]|nr:MAG: salicylate hydroxylase [Betaproteobacteria bacterium]
MSKHIETHFAVTQLHARYASAVDANDWDAWVDCFIDDCVYRIQPRENFERGFPLATLSFESKGMLRDRAYGIKETLFHDPYYQRHIVGAPLIQSVTDECIKCEANYVVIRTKLSELSTVYNAGRYIDEIVHTEAGLKLKSRQCIYDSEMIPNSIIYPI